MTAGASGDGPARPPVAAADTGRLRRLALLALSGTLLQVTWGAFTRGSGSGFGCRDRWPLCEGGWLQIGDAGGLLPRPEFAMVVEWLHRWIALVVGVLVVWLAVAVWRRLPGLPRVRIPAVLAVAVLVAQSLVGAAVVVSELRADLVMVHLTGALVLLGLLAHLAVQVHLPSRRDGDRAGAPGSRGWSRWLAAGGLVLLATMLLGSSVHNQYVAGWPLVGGSWLPAGLGDSSLVTLHYLHRLLAGAGLVLVAWLAWQAHRRGRPVAERRLTDGLAVLFALNVGLGGVHVVTQVSSTVAVVAHLGVGAAAWSAAVAAWSLARHHDRRPRPAPTPRRAGAPRAEVRTAEVGGVQRGGAQVGGAEVGGA